MAEIPKQCDLTGIVERHLLVAVDASDNARRAVLFVGDFFGCYAGISVTLLNIILEPEATFFANEKERVSWQESKLAEAKATVAQYRAILLDAGFPEEKLHERIEIRQSRSVADCIIEEQNKLRCCSVVIGRRGITKKEEFIFGSTSSKILHEARNCAVMVIE